MRENQNHFIFELVLKRESREFRVAITLKRGWAVALALAAIKIIAFLIARWAHQT